MNPVLISLSVVISYVIGVALTLVILDADIEKQGWLGHFITIIGIALGAIMVVFQIGRQHKNELALLKENRREELKLRVYDEFHLAMNKTHEATLDVGLYVFNMPYEFEFIDQRLAQGVDFLPAKKRAKSLASYTIRRIHVL